MTFLRVLILILLLGSSIGLGYKSADKTTRGIGQSYYESIMINHNYGEYDKQTGNFKWKN